MHTTKWKTLIHLSWSVYFTSDTSSLLYIWMLIIRINTKLPWEKIESLIRLAVSISQWCLLLSKRPLIFFSFLPHFVAAACGPGLGWSGLPSPAMATIPLLQLLFFLSLTSAQSLLASISALQPTKLHNNQYHGGHSTADCITELCSSVHLPLVCLKE